MKRLRKKANFPWINSDVKSRLFKRDALKRKAIKTNKDEDWLLFKSSRNVANIAMRRSNKQNPKKVWRTINDILGRNKKHAMINEIKMLRKTVTSTDELVDVFNDHFSNIGPRLA